MAVTQAQKVDFLLKKIGFTKTKTGLAVDETLSGTKKAGFAEAIPSPLIIANDSLWNESSLIPATPPGSDTSQVKVYLASSSGHQMTVDSTVAGNRAFIAFSTYNNTSSARLNNWIDTQFGSSYLIKVFRGDPNSGGVQLSAAGSGNNDGWFFDYSAGVLNFNDTNVPSGVTSSNIYIVGYRYIGLTGAPTPTGAGNFTFNNLTVTGDIDVDAHTNLDNVSIAGIVTATTINATTFAGDGDFFDLDVDGHTNLDNVSVAGVTTFSGDVITGVGATVGIGSTVFFGGNAEARFGGTASSPDLRIYSDGTYSRIRSTEPVIFTSSGPLNISGSTNNTLQSNNNRLMTMGAVEIIETDTTTAYLKHSGNTKLQTTAAGVSISEDLDVDGHTNLDNVSIAGVVTATTFIGALTGNASGNAGTATALQTARNIGGVSFDGTSDIDLPGVNIAGNQDTSGTAAGLSGSPSINITNLTAVDGTFSGNVSIGGTLTYEDVTNIDSVGLVTARSGIFLPDSQKAQFGNVAGSADLEIYHDGNHSYIHDGGTGNLKVRSNNLRVSNGDESKLYATFTPTAVELYYNNIKRLETTGIGIAVNGKTDTQLLDVNGRANIFDMEVSGISTFAGNVDINVDLDVDGHTNLDNVSIVGVATVTGSNINIEGGSASISQLKINSTGRYRGVQLDENGTRKAHFQHDATDNKTVVGTAEGTMQFNSGDTPRVILNSSGHWVPYADSTYDLGINGTRWRNVYADTLYGDGSNLTGITQTTINSNTNNYLITGTGTANTLQGEAGLTFDGSILSNTGTGFKEIKINPSTNNSATLRLQNSQANFTVSNITGGSFSIADGSDTRLTINSSGTVGINNDLDVDGHTNLDNVSIAGVTTHNDNVHLLDNDKLLLGGSAYSFDGLELFHDGNHSYIKDSGSGNLYIGTNQVWINDPNNSNPSAVFNPTGHSALYYIGSEKIRTADKGIQVGTGVTVETNGQATFTGIVTAASFRGDGSQLSGISVDASALKDPNGNIKIQAQASGAVHVGIATFQDIDVDGHTNLDNVNISGVTTITSNVLYLKSASGSGPTISAITGSDVLNLASNGLIVKNQNGWKGLEFTGSSIELYSGQMASHKLVLQTNSSGVALPLDLDVDGHTNLDNVSVAGVTTFSGGSVIINPNSATHATFTINSQESNDSPGPIINLSRNSGFFSSTEPLGEIRFVANNNKNYGKITGRTTNTGSGSEDGKIQVSVIKNGTETVVTEFTHNGVDIPFDLDVDGHTNLDNVSVAGVTTFTGAAEFDSDARFDSTITAGGGTGNTGQYLKSTGTGVAWESFPTMRTTTTVTASAGQTTFSFSYNVGFLDVFINGTKLTDSEFTATNGTSVVLAVGCFVGDIVDLISYNTVSGGGGGGGGSSITVQDEGSSLSTAAETLNFVGTGVVASGTGATKTITINTGTASTAEIRTNTLEVVGVTTFQNTVLVQGSNTRLNIGDANSQLYMSGNVLYVDGYARDIQLRTNAGGGVSSDIILHSGGVGELLRAHGTGDVDIINTLGIGGSITKASGQLDIRADNLQLKNAASGATYASFTNGGAVELNHNNTKRLETTSNGVNVIGSLFVNGSAIGGGGGGSSLFSQTVAGIHTLSKVGIGTADPEFDLDLGSYTSQNVSTASTIRIMGDGASSANTAIRFGAGGNNVDYTLLRVDGQDGTTDGDGNTDLGFALRYMSAGESGTDNRIAFWADNTNKTKYEALSIYNDGRVLVDNGAGGGHSFYGHPDDHFTVRGSSGFDNVRVVGVSTFQNVLPQTDSTYDIGTNTVRFRNIYADTLYGDGSNLTGISGGGGTDVGITTALSGNFNASSGVATINTYSYHDDDKVVEYTIYVKNGSDFQTSKVLAMRDSTTIHSTQFAVMFSSSLLVQFDATISSGNINLRATPESGVTGTTDYKIKREVM